MLIVHEIKKNYANTMSGAGGLGNASSHLRILNRYGKELFYFSNIQKSVQGFKFSPDSKKIAVLGGDGITQIFDLSGREIQRLRNSSGTASKIIFSPDSSKVMLSSSNSSLSRRESYDNILEKEEVHIWNLSNNISRLIGHKGNIYDVKFSPHSQTIATRGLERTTRVWNLDGNELLRLNIRYEDLGAYVETPDTKDIKKYNEHIKLLDRLDWSPESLSAGLSSMIRSPNDETSYAKGPDGALYPLDIDTSEQKVTLYGSNPYPKSRDNWNTQEAGIAAYHPESSMIATASRDDMIDIHSSNTGEKIKSIAIPRTKVNHLVFRPDGKAIALVTKDGSVKVLDLDGNPLHDFRSSQSTIRDVTYDIKHQVMITQEQEGIGIRDFSGRILNYFPGRGTVNLDLTKVASIHMDSAEQNEFVEINPLEFNLDALLRDGCDRLKYYLIQSPELKDDRRMCGFE